MIRQYHLILRPPGASRITTFFPSASPLRTRQCQKRVAFSGKAIGENPSQSLSRKDRRILERKQRNKARRELSRPKEEVKSDNSEPVAAVSSKILKRLLAAVHPKVPGTNTAFSREHLFSLGYRVPLFLAFCIVLTSDDLSPYAIRGSIGPSMLPTIQTFGDLWLVETWAFHRLLGWDPTVQVGNIVLWKDPETKRESCKRIVGVSGDRVLRFGQYASLYRYRKDLGILSLHKSSDRELDIDSSWDPQKPNENLSNTYLVPEGHVWLEGDCPLLSFDSRHYGPIPTSWLSGRLVYRIWPLEREDVDGEVIPKAVGKNRPKPFSSIEQYLGKTYNLHKVSKDN